MACGKSTSQGEDCTKPFIQRAHLLFICRMFHDAPLAVWFGIIQNSTISQSHMSVWVMQNLGFLWFSISLLLHFPPVIPISISEPFSAYEMPVRAILVLLAIIFESLGNAITSPGFFQTFFLTIMKDWLCHLIGNVAWLDIELFELQRQRVFVKPPGSLTLKFLLSTVSDYVSLSYTSFNTSMKNCLLQRQ